MQSTTQANHRTMKRSWPSLLLLLLLLGVCALPCRSDYSAFNGQQQGFGFRNQPFVGQALRAGNGFGTRLSPLGRGRIRNDGFRPRFNPPPQPFGGPGLNRRPLPQFAGQRIQRAVSPSIKGYARASSNNGQQLQQFYVRQGPSQQAGNILQQQTLQGMMPGSLRTGSHQYATGSQALTNSGNRIVAQVAQTRGGNGLYGGQGSQQQGNNVYYNQGSLTNAPGLSQFSIVDQNFRVNNKQVRQFLPQQSTDLETYYNDFDKVAGPFPILQGFQGSAPLPRRSTTQISRFNVPQTSTRNIQFRQSQFRQPQGIRVTTQQQINRPNIRLTSPRFTTATNFGGFPRQRLTGVRRFVPASSRFSEGVGANGATTINLPAGNADFDVNTFSSFLDASAFGLDNIAPNYVSLGLFDFNNWRREADSLAPPEAFSASLTEEAPVVIGKRYRSGIARTMETSSAEREGNGSGEAGVEVSATRSANQDATQSFTQDGAGEGETAQGADYSFSQNNDGTIVFQAVPHQEELRIHAGPASAVPTGIEIPIQQSLRQSRFGTGVTSFGARKATSAAFGTGSGSFAKNAHHGHAGKVTAQSVSSKPFRGTGAYNTFNQAAASRTTGYRNSPDLSTYQN
ncbi:PREDICTED: uncharacterized protein LOC106821510 [Priapulus caudatus]|uniref:Uncharacterized protein LOC106821510 n=1 Tax=Priapulus caudatus TaxID=37621 RepID=A0ABM1FBM2_PRICU|nr:PREDICTED: uncharacterized protein LOC106821510 [Priapulus caudatus]